MRYNKIIHINTVTYPSEVQNSGRTTPTTSVMPNTLYPELTTHSNTRYGYYHCLM